MNTGGHPENMKHARNRFLRKGFLFPLTAGAVLGLAFRSRTSPLAFLSDLCFLVGVSYLVEGLAIIVWRLGVFDSSVRGTKKFFAIVSRKPFDERGHQREEE